MYLIHRDLKLENILLANKDSQTIKIVDFGIAGLANNFSVTNIDIGTLRYMPPEILNGTVKDIEPTIDVWAMGIILYGMVVGKLPFDKPTIDETIQSIKRGLYSIPAEVELSMELKDLLSRILMPLPF